MMNTPDGYTGEALQAAIDAVPEGGGTIWVPRGTYSFGDRAVVVPEGKHRVQLLCESGTVFLYHGSGPALQVGGDWGNTEGFGCQDARLACAGTRTTMLSVSGWCARSGPRYRTSGWYRITAHLILVNAA